MVVSRRPRLSRISTDRQRRQKSSLFSFVVPYNCLQLADAREEDGTIIFYPGAAEASPINRTMRSTPETSCFSNENTVSYFTQATFTARMNYLERSCRYDYQLANSVWCQWKKGARGKRVRSKNGPTYGTAGTGEPNNVHRSSFFHLSYRDFSDHYMACSYAMS